MKQDFQKHTLRLFEGDFLTLQELYPDIGASEAIRRLVREHIKKRTSPIDPTKIKTEVEL
jgi:hypothetical protein